MSSHLKYSRVNQKGDQEVCLPLIGSWKLLSHEPFWYTKNIITNKVAFLDHPNKEQNWLSSNPSYIHSFVKFTQSPIQGEVFIRAREISQEDKTTHKHADTHARLIAPRDMPFWVAKKIYRLWNKVSCFKRSHCKLDHGVSWRWDIVGVIWHLTLATGIPTKIPCLGLISRLSLSRQWVRPGKGLALLMQIEGADEVYPRSLSTQPGCFSAAQRIWLTAHELPFGISMGALAIFS